MKGKLSKREAVFFKSLRNFSRVVTNLIDKNPGKSQSTLTLKASAVEQLVNLKNKIVQLIDLLELQVPAQEIPAVTVEQRVEAEAQNLDGKDTVDHPNAPEPDKPRSFSEPLRLPFKKRKVKVVQLNPRECPVCHRILSSKAARQNHVVMMHTSDRPFQCSVCSRGFPANYLLQYHIKSHEPPKYECRYCEKRFPHLFLKTQHEETHVGNKDYACESCGKTFLRASNLKLHRQVHQEKKTFQCAECGAAFSQKLNLSVHLRKHTGVGMHPCDKCDKQFTRLVELKRHYVSHEDARSHLCATCGKRFKYAASLKHHLKVSHNSEGKEVTCQMCPLTFHSESTLAKHEKKHTTCQYQCSECYQLFVTSAKLTSHVNKHHVNKEFVCSCGANFASREKLIAHAKVHELNAVCGICNKRFKTEKNLFYHKKKCHPGDYALMSALGCAVEFGNSAVEPEQLRPELQARSRPQPQAEQIINIIQSDGSVLAFMQVS